jgi:hypothetical protein
MCRYNRKAKLPQNNKQTPKQGRIREKKTGNAKGKALMGMRV